ncbi:MAG: S8 family serine peptidase, partial [Vicinamibacteria bacterium]|nr:S8 family serine peptidase [Vicinamibacteria bacterium]
MIGRRLFVVFLVGVTVLSAIVANAQRASSGSASAVRVGDAPETAAAGAVELQVVESEGASAPQPATLAIESGAGPSVAGAFAETGARREYRARESRTTYHIEITGAADSGALAELGLTASTPGTQRYSVSREQLIGLRERGIGLRVLGGKTTHVFAAGGPMAEGATAITPPTVVNSTGHYTLSSGTLNRPVPDQGWASLGLTVIGFGAPAGSTTTRLSYRLRIHNDADPYAFWCSDYRIFLSSTATGGAAPSVLVYENLGDQTDLGFDDDPEDDYDIYLDWRTTHAFDGQDPNQTWFVYVTDDLQDDTGFIEYVEFDVYWDGPDDLVASDVYFRTAAAGGGTRVDNPVIGQELYPHIDFVVAGAAASGRLWALDLDGTALCEATDTLAADAYTGWCASPVTITEGNHTLRGRVDPDGTITEGDETNNEATRNFTVALLTDLLATDVYFRTAAAGGGVRVDSPREGQQLYLHADYAVAHTGTSGTLWELTLDATPLCDLTTSAATGSYVGWCNSPVTITAGSHQAQLIVDPLAAISEASESNNVASRTFSIAPDIRVNPLTLSFLGSGNTVPTAGPGAAAPGAEVRGATATPRRDRRIHLRSGSFDPLEHGQSAAGYDAGAAVAVASASAGRHVVLQFESTVSPEEREALAQRGIRLLRYLPTNAYWAAVEPGAGRLAGTSEGGGVRAAWTLPGEHKLTPELARGAFPRTARQADGRVRVVVRVFDDVAAPEAQAALASVRGAELLELRSERSWLVATTPERIGAIAALDAVESVEPAPGLRAADNLVAAGRIRASDAWAAPYSLSGLGVAVGIWDEDAVASHGDFGARLSVHDAGTPSSHSTHVAGTVGGSGAGNASARGMASQAQLHSWNWDDDALEMRSAAQAGTVDISNHSYGWIAGWYFDGSTWVDEGPALFGAYTSEAADWDALVAETGLLPFKSSGNDRDDGPDWPAGPRTDGPYDTISGQGNAKNLVTVGATTDADGMTSFSSWGPADDGRVKPDVCANGSGLLSTQPGGSYASFSGTSMASPSAAGAAALLQQRYESQTGQRPRPDELKALLLHGAVDLAPAGPDYQCGFGLLDVKASADLVRNGLWRTGSIASTGQAQTFTVAIAAGTPRFKATLVWTDPPGSTSAATALVNDLDVWLESPTGAISRPWVLNGASPSAAATQGENRVDNVEQVVVQSPAAGNWIVHVSGHAVGLGPQPYTIVSEALTAGGSGSSTFTISNDGVATLNVSSITPDQPAPWIQLAPATPLTIAPGGSVTVEVTIDYAQAPVGQTTRRLLIASNDADENPFPGGVYVAVDRPTPPTLAVGDVSLSEGHAGTSVATFTVTLSRAMSNPVTVQYATADDSAVAGVDYVAASGTLTFAPGETSRTFGVTVNGDTAVEIDEAFVVDLSNPVLASIADSRGVGTIRSDEPPPLATWANPVGVAPSGGSLTKTAATSNWDSGAVSVERVAAGNACVEFTATETTTYRAVGLGTGDSNQGIGDIEYSIALVPGAGFWVYESGTVRPAGSGTFVGGDKFAVCVESGVVKYRRNGAVFYASAVAPTYPLRVDTSLYTPGSTVTDARVLGLVEPPPALSVNDVSVSEGNAGTTTATFTVTLAVASASTVTVDYATSNGTASAGSDYAAASGTLTFNPGITSQTFGVTVNGDTAAEFTETFTVTLSNPTNAELGDGTGVGTIVNDDAPPAAMWTNVVGVAPSGASLTKTAVTSNWDAGAVSVQMLSSGDGCVEFTATETTTYRALGLGTGDANQGIGDIEHGIALFPGAGFSVYESGAARTAGSGTFASGDVFSVCVESGVVKYRRNGAPIYTSLVAPSYPLRVDTSLYSPGSTITNVRVLGLVEPPPALSVNDVSVSEGNAGTTTATFTVNLSAASPSPVTVDYATSNGTATAGSDYAAASGTLTFNPGIVSQTFGVTVNGDTAIETNETFTVTLSNATNAAIGDGTGVGTITNDDAPPAAMWTNVVGVAPSGASLTKTAVTSNWDAGAVSVQTLGAGDGCVEFTATETTTYRALGLGTGDANQGIGDIEHGIALVPGAGFWVYESGAARTAGSGTFVGGDRFAVCVESGVVKYRRNGA